MKYFYYPRVLLTFIGLCLSNLVPSISVAQCLLEPVSLSKRATEADVIVEGRVFFQESFWKLDSSGIYTSHLIRIYKVLKGNTTFSEIELVTPGGIVGMDMEVVNPSLQLHSGEVGIFFLQRETGFRERPFQTRERALYRPYSSVQGFIRYDEVLGKAGDVFDAYNNIQRELFEPIQRYTRQAPLAISSYQLEPTKAGTRATPVISNISPQIISAGTSSVLTITGSNFETQGGNSAVFFPNPDNGGNSLISVPSANIISWSNQEIQVRVPSEAGSGSVRVRNQSNSQAVSTPITISYSQYNVTYGGVKYPVYMANENGQGGYTLSYGINTSNNGVDFRTQGQEPFERALGKWQCETGFNVIVSGTTTVNTPSGSNQPNVVMFDNDSNPLPAGVLGRTYSGFSSCTATTWYLKGFDIVYNRNIPWHYDKTDPCFSCYDFESVSLHELGHGHLMGHVIDNSKIMHYAIANGVAKRSLDPSSAITGGQEIIAVSQGVDLCFGLIPSMQVHDQSCGGEIPYFQASVLLEGYMLPDQRLMHTYLSDQQLLPQNQPFDTAPYHYAGTEYISSFPENTTDWVLVELRNVSDYSQVAGRVALLLRNDGMLMTTEGDTLIHVEGVEAGTYHMAVYHPRHLGVISSSGLTYDANAGVYDFTSAQGQAAGSGQLKQIDGRYTLLGGDYDGNGVIDQNDYQLWRAQNVEPDIYIRIDGDGSGSVNVHDFNIWARNKNISGHSAIQNP